MNNIFPNCVQGKEEDLITYDMPMSIDYGRITPLLYSALKQSISEIETLKTTIIDLQYQIDVLKNAINNINDVLNI